MKLNKKQRGFRQLSKTWYGQANIDKGKLDEVAFGYYDGETVIAEMTMTWLNFGEEAPRMHLAVWGNSFAMLEDGLLPQQLSETSGMTPEKFAEHLVLSKFKNLTETEMPADPREANWTAAGQVMEYGNQMRDLEKDLKRNTIEYQKVVARYTEAEKRLYAKMVGDRR